MHGRWSYFRMCLFLKYFFYKGFALNAAVWFAGFACGWSAPELYDSGFLAMYNVIYSAVPIIVMGIFEQDVDAGLSMRFPILYEAGLKNKLFTWPTFFVSVIKGVFHGGIMYAGIATAMLGGGAVEEDGTTSNDGPTMAAAIAFSCIVVTHIELWWIIQHWTVLHWLAMAVGPTGYLATFIPIYMWEDDWGYEYASFVTCNCACFPCL